MNEICVGGLHSSSAHLQSDLAAMIRRMKKHMRQYVLHTAGPDFAFAVAVLHFVIERTRRKLISQPRENLWPRHRHLIRQRRAIVDCKRRPYRSALRLFQNAFEPQ